MLRGDGHRPRHYCFSWIPDSDVNGGMTSARAVVYGDRSRYRLGLIVLVGLDQASPGECETGTRVQKSRQVSGCMMKAGNAICVGFGHLTAFPSVAATGFRAK